MFEMEGEVEIEKIFEPEIGLGIAEVAEGGGGYGKGGVGVIFEFGIEVGCAGFDGFGQVEGLSAAGAVEGDADVGLEQGGLGICEILGVQELEDFDVLEVVEGVVDQGCWLGC